jgi:hypothetical protein
VKGRDHLEDLTTNGKIILDLKEIRQGICWLNSCDLGSGPVVVPCEHDNERFSFKFLNYVSFSGTLLHGESNSFMYS